MKRVVARVTFKHYVDTALFNVFLEVSKKISISICKPQNYLDCVTSKGKGLRILDVLAMLELQTRVTLLFRTVYFCNVWVCSFWHRRYYSVLT